MAHGRHRKGAGRSVKTRFGSIKRVKAEIEENIVPLSSLLVDQDHMVHDGDAVEQTFNLMACAHPAQCTCEAQYPFWKPGQR